MLIEALLGGSFVGFLAGLFSFRVKSRWCPEHGVPMTCPYCRTNSPAPERERR
jgi:hypothetical protein